MDVIINARFLTQPITGVQRFAIELSKLLKKELKEQIHFITPANIIHQDIARQLSIEIIGKKSGHLWEQIELPNHLKKQGNPLLLNLCNTAPLFYKNKIVTIHDVGFEAFPQTYSKGFLYFYKFLIPRILKTSKQVITVSNFSKNEIIKYYKTAPNKIFVIYNAAGQEFHSKINMGLRNQQYFLAVSSLNHRKNLPLVLESFNLLSVQNSNIKLFVIGGLDDNSFAKLDLEKYKKNKQIEFKGRVSDEELVEYYSNAIAFIYPSFYEGFGIPPLEAQNCDCPVIVSEDSCLPEIFEGSVLYCDSRDSESLLQKMKLCLLPNERAGLIAKGKINTQNYSWDSSCKELINLIKSIHNR